MADKIKRRLQNLGEETKVQLKERLVDRYDVACELVAFSNSRGGSLVVGVDDKTGKYNPLSYKEVQETVVKLGNVASENVVPSILIDIENVKVRGGTIVLVHVKEGLNKPYRDNKGIVWVKNGADKRKVFDNAELAEMMTDCGNFVPDEAAVPDATIADLDETTIKMFLRSKFSAVLERKGMVGDKLNANSVDNVCSAIAEGHDLTRVFCNLRFIRPNGQLTVAAMLLFGKYTQRWLPTMTAKCICFVGNDISGTKFRDKVNDNDMEGNILHQFETIMAFFKRNLKNVQVDNDFNSQGQLEIPYISLLEFTVNALVHRSLNWTAPIRIFIFDNRVEIHSPGNLPNGLSVSDILAGTSMPRNNFLFNNAIHLLPYTGVGSGIQRALANGLEVHFTDNQSAHEFVITIDRECTHDDDDESNYDNGLESTHDAALESNHDGASESTHEINHDSTHDSAPKSNYDADLESTHDSSQESNHDADLESTHDSDLKNTHDGTQKSNYESNHDAAENAGSDDHNRTQESSNKSTHDADLESTHDTASESNHDGAQEISNKSNHDGAHEKVQNAGSGDHESNHAGNYESDSGSTHDITPKSNHDTDSESNYDAALESTYDGDLESTHDGTHEVPENAGSSDHDSTPKSNYDNGLESTHDGAHEVPENAGSSGHDSTHDSTHDAGLESNYDSGLESNHEVPENTGSGGHQSNHDATENAGSSTPESTHDGTQESNYDAALESNHDGTQESAHESKYDGTHEGVHEVPENAGPGGQQSNYDKDLESTHDSAQESNLDTDLKTTHDGTHKVRKKARRGSRHKAKLMSKQRDICNFCSVPRTSQEIMDRLGISNQNTNRQRYIAPLLKKGMLEMTIPEKPKSKNQKYRSVKRK